MDELYHHGILGQRWGVRRFQNADGSLTSAGRKRVSKLENKYSKLTGTNLKKKKSSGEESGTKISKPKKVKSIRDLSTEEIIKKIEENKEELFNLRFAQATGNLEKPSRINELRKEVARMKTIIRERELQK